MDDTLLLALLVIVSSVVSPCVLGLVLNSLDRVPREAEAQQAAESLAAKEREDFARYDRVAARLLAAHQSVERAALVVNTKLDVLLADKQ